MAAVREKILWKGLWAACGKEDGMPVLSPLSMVSTHFIHRISTTVDGSRCLSFAALYPSAIFLRISSRLRLNSASSCIMVSIRPQAEMAVVWSVRSNNRAIRL